MCVFVCVRVGVCVKCMCIHVWYVCDQARENRAYLHINWIPFFICT